MQRDLFWPHDRGRHAAQRLTYSPGDGHAMSRTFHRELGAAPADIAEAGAQLSAWLVEESIPESAALLARLTLDELASNVAKYGGGRLDELSIRFRCSVDCGRLVIDVDDNARPFDPRDAPSPDLDAPLDERRPGGLGLHLLRRLSNSFRYERRDGRNCVTLVADFPA